MTTEGWWYEGAGIYRHVRLIVKEPLHIAHDSIFAKPELIEDSGNDWRVICEATAENSSYEDKKFRVRTELLYKGEAVSVGESEEFTCPADGKATARHTLVVTDPARWDIDDPELYTARFSLVSGDICDEEETTFGFRTFTVDPDKGFFLNGREIKLKGTCNHHGPRRCRCSRSRFHPVLPHKETEGAWHERLPLLPQYAGEGNS